MKKRSTNIVIRLISLILLCVLLPSSIICIQWMRNVEQVLHEQLVNDTAAKLQQTDIALTLMNENISLIYREFVSSAEFKEYSVLADGAFLEQERAPFDDLAKTAHYVTLKGAVRDLMREYITGADSLDSIYFYDENKNVVISYTWLDATADSFFDLEWLQYVDASNRSTVITPVRTIDPELSDARHVISIVYMPLVRNNTVYIVFNLSADVLYRNYFLDGSIEAGDELIVFSPSGQLLLAATASGVADMSTELQARSLADYKAVGGTGYVGTRRMSSGITLLYRRTADLVQQQVSRARRIVLLIVAFATLAIVGTIGYITIQLTYPTRSITRRRERDKVPLLLRGTELEDVQHWIRESASAFDYRYWSLAISGYPAAQEGTEHLQRDFVLACLQLAESDGTAGGYLAPDWERIQRRFYHNLQDVRLEMALLSETTLLIAAACAEEQMRQICGRLEDAYYRAMQEAAAEGLFAIGGYCREQGDIQEYWARAAMILRYQTITGSTQMHFDRQIEHVTGNASTRIFEINSRLSANLRKENYQEACLNLQNVRDILAEHAQELSYLQIRHFTLFAVATVVEEYLKHDAAAETALPNDLYRRVMAANNLDEVFETALGLINGMNAADAESAPQETNEYVQQLLAMLQEDCGSEMNLSAVAERLGLSTAYLSKIFKRVVGVNYSQYLTERRVEKAKQLLRQGDRQIQDIAELLGYSQSHYFSKIFRQYTGMTPSEYIRREAGSEPDGTD